MRRFCVAYANAVGYESAMIETRLLAAALRILRPVGKILEVHATRKNLTFYAWSDLNLRVMVTIPYGTEHAFACGVDLQSIGRYLTHTPAQAVKLRLDVDGLVVTSDTEEARFVNTAQEKVPPITRLRADLLPWMEASDLHQALRRVERCVPRQGVQLLHLVPTKEGATFVSVGESRAVQLTRRMPFVPPLALNRDALDVLCPALRYATGTVQAAKGAAVLSFQPKPELDVWVEPVDHSVYNPTHLIPVVPSTFSLEVDRERLLQSLRCLRAVQRKPRVRLSASGSRLKLTTEDASITMDILCRTTQGIPTGEVRTTSYRTTHLIEGIDRLHGTRCTLEIGAEDQPLTICAGGNYRYTVMAARATEVA